MLRRRNSRLGPLAPAEEHAEPAPAFLQGELDLLPDLVVVGDRFLGLARERDPDRAHVDEDHHGAGGERAARLGHPVVAPRGLERGLEGRAGRLLVEQRDAIGVPDDTGQLVVVLAILAFRERHHGRVRRGGGDLVRRLAEGQPGLDDERIAAVHRGRSGHRGVELTLDLLVEAVEDRLLADGRDAVRGRRHDLGRLDGLVERLGGVAVHVARPRVRRELGRLADLHRDRGRDPAEVAREEPGERVAPGVVEHAQEHAELDAVGMRLDLAGRGRQLLDRPRVLPGVALRGVVDERHVRIGDRDLLEELVHRGAALLVAPFDLERHLRAARMVPVDLLALEDPGLVLLGVDLDLEVVRRGPRPRARGDLHRLAGRELRVHARRGDADALLAAAHPEPVELRAVQQLGEDRRDLLADDAGPVVDDGDAEARGLAGRHRCLVAARRDLERDDHLGQDAGLFGRVERVVHRFLDAGEQGLARIVEAEQMAVLGEELGDGDLPLARAHLGGGWGDLRLGGRRPRECGGHSSP